MQKIVTNLWFDTEAEEAAEFYTSLFEDGRIVSTSHYTEAVPDKAGMVLTVEFELQGQRFVGINGGPEFKFDEAISLQVNCKRPGRDRLLLGEARPRAAPRASAAGSRTATASPGRSSPRTCRRSSPIVIPPRPSGR